MSHLKRAYDAINDFRRIFYTEPNEVIMSNATLGDIAEECFRHDDAPRPVPENDPFPKYSVLGKSILIDNSMERGVVMAAVVCRPIDTPNASNDNSVIIHYH
jgi:hypothetical protein